MKLSFGFQKTSINKGTYQDIISSGNLNIITNFDLRAAIVDYYIATEGTDLVDKYYSQYFNDFIMPLIFKEYDILKDKFSDPNIINTVYFSNRMAGYFSMVQQQNISYSSLLSKSYKLRDLLEKNK